jgi:hypothetical protein
MYCKSYQLYYVVRVLALANLELLHISCCTSAAILLTSLIHERKDIIYLCTYFSFSGYYLGKALLSTVLEQKKGSRIGILF